MSRRKKTLRVLLWGFLAVVGLAGVALGTMDSWLFVALNPGVFDARQTPPAPNYK